MVDPNNVRASGRTTAHEIAHEAVKNSEINEKHSSKLAATPSDIEQHRRFRSPGFSRLTVDWSKEDKIVLTRAQNAVEKKLISEFSDAYQIMNRLYDLIRIPKMKDGNPLRDQNGWIIWQVDDFGHPIEDWEKLTYREKDNLLFSITSKLFNWEQTASKAWAESMYAKANWEESFAFSFENVLSGTVQDREQRGRIGSVDERLFAIFLSSYSRSAEALVRSMDRLALRLRDTLK
jgi:hypothetical protein